MISICIPIYNYDASKLVHDLHDQACELGVDYEFILLDDVSSESFRKINRELSNLDKVVYRENEVNIGLSKMRNRLAEMAGYPYLIFIDSDAVVTKPDYLKKYIEQCRPNIVCFGGCVYPAQRPDKEHILRWKFGKKREEGKGRYYSCFNFMADSKIIQQYPFSEDLRQYGYEDNLFGATLKHAGVDITFLDNPMLHPGLDTADGYLKKIELSISNLIFIEPFLVDEEMRSSIRLLVTYTRLKKMHLTGMVNISFKILKSLCLKNLRSSNPRLFILDFYKLGLLCSKKKA